MRYLDNLGNATQNPAEHPLWPQNIYGPIPRVKCLDLLTSVCQHIYEFLCQVGFFMQVVGPGFGYSIKVVSFMLDQYLSDPYHRWPSPEDDSIVMFIDYPLHILAHLQQKNISLCFRTSSQSISLVSPNTVEA